jgi:Asp-tRNA(Asn)/Glu-tRNA(Gln) amidotransferase A subunit family amidase
MTDLNRLHAADIARRVRAGQLTAEAVVRDCIARIAEREAAVQAWVHFDADTALAQARAIDRSASKGLLAGVPVGVKDIIDTADMPTRYNSAIYRDHRPRADASCVALVRRAGGIILGKTVTTEFASREPGPTRNPHNPAHTPGGSSSGSAAAVADCMAPLGFGTQTGGSTIRPAAYCGVTGYKPSYNTINAAGMKHLAESLDTIGVIGRSVEDCALLVHAVSARPLPDFSVKLDKAPRIGLCRTSRWASASPETQALLENTARTLAAHGANVSDIERPAGFDRLYDTQRVIADFEAGRSLAWEFDHHPDLLSEFMRTTLPKDFAIARTDYADTMRHARECRLRLVDATANIDVLLTPSAPGEAPSGLRHTGDPIFNRNWTLLGAACVTVPAGYGPNGLPLGVQLVAPYDEDYRVLQCAHWVSKALG